MKVRVKGPLAEVIEASEVEKDLVKSALSFPVSSMRIKYEPHKGRHVSWSSDKKEYFFENRYFPSPFLSLFPSSIKLEVEDDTTECTPLSLDDLPYELKPFQRTALDNILSKRSALVVGPTSIGKTYLIGALVYAFRNSKVLILVHNKGLAKQNYERLRDWMPQLEFGRVFGGRKEFDSQIVVATFQSLRSLPFKADVVLVDECVHALAPSYIQTLMHTEAPRWYGFTATPSGRSDRLDEKLRVLFGDRVDVADLSVGLKEKLLCPVDFYVLKYSNKRYPVPGWRLQDSNWIYQQFVALDQDRNALIKLLCDLELQRTQKVVLVLVHRMNHLEQLKSLIPGSLTVSYKSRLEEREAARKLERGVLVATRVIEEGVDNHSIYSIINAACVRSQIAIIQRIGRGLRFEEGKRLAFFDIWDQFPPVLRSQGNFRIALYKRFGDVHVLDPA
ncbi:DEAD/DEAH box helicase family protein [bacterium]|nr:DEAD/DEAH box helicase family protein [bacterium]